VTSQQTGLASHSQCCYLNQLRRYGIDFIMNQNMNSTSHGPNRSSGASPPESDLAPYPVVTIVIPCRNEADYIVACLDSLAHIDYPLDKLEIFVVDGMSTDGTRDIVQTYIQQYACVHMLDNPKLVTPSAMNIGIKYAKGDVIIIMGAHSEYPSHYISTCVSYLNKMQADVVGGPVVTKPGADTFIAKAIALATSHPFGVGNSRFRTSSEAGFVDTVPFGAFRREVFNQVGIFDERLVRNQDNEFNSRVIQHNGRIYLTPDLTVWYYNQATITGLLKQALTTGMWNVNTLIINSSAFRWRHFIPFGFVSVVGVLGITAWLFSSYTQLALVCVLCVYGSAALVSSMQIGCRDGMKYVGILPVIFFSYHVCYGLGTWIGIIKAGLTLWVSEKWSGIFS